MNIMTDDGKSSFLLKFYEIAERFHGKFQNISSSHELFLTFNSLSESGSID